jgi:hypothetical protein
MGKTIVIFASGGRAFIRLEGGWLDLGPEDDVLRLAPGDQLALIRDRAQKPVWHEIPRRPM